MWQALKATVWMALLSVTILTGSWANGVSSIKVSQLTADLPKVGVVKKTRTGYTYLSVSQQYIKRLMPALVKALPTLQSCLYQDHNSIGAHVTLYEPEWGATFKTKNLLGKRYHFQPEKMIEFLVPEVYQGKKEYKIWYVLLVKSPLLTQALKNAGLKKLPTLHISIAYSYWDASRAHCKPKRSF